jgi:Ca-activated chloride channel family protein
MTFLSPDRLWLLLGVLALLVAYLLVQRRRKRSAVRFAALPLLARVAPSPGWRRHVPAALFMAMAVVLVTGFARPEADVRVPREEATVVVALDLSGSMRATDVSPDRFSVAQEAAEQFIAELPEQYQVGLVSFSTTASLDVPPTTDRAEVQRALASMSPDGGTAIGDAITTSVEASQRAAADGEGEPVPARVVLLSDGQNSQGSPVDAGIQAALGADVPVSTIAYGTDGGTLGNLSVPVDRETLAQIADETGGEAYEAASAEELEGVYEDLGSSIGYRTETQEISSWFIGGGLVLAMLAAAASLRFTGRLP